jgi:uncharacterized membrane protein YphA (DoxX/SURF4 family)
MHDLGARWRSILPVAARVTYAGGAILLGGAGLVFADFARQWQPVPPGLPNRPLLAILSAAILFGGGVLLLAERSQRLGGAICAGMFALWLSLHIPVVAAAGARLVTWLGVAEISALVLGGAILAAQVPRRGPRPLDLLVRVYGLCPLVFGASHLAYPDFTASMVPSWIPSPLFWAYFTGFAHIAAGIAILSGVQARRGSTLLGVMMAAFAMLVHVPRLWGEPASHAEWVMLGLAVALAGSAFAVRAALARTAS